MSASMSLDKGQNELLGRAGLTVTVQAREKPKEWIAMKRQNVACVVALVMCGAI